MLPAVNRPLLSCSVQKMKHQFDMTVLCMCCLKIPHSTSTFTNKISPVTKHHISPLGKVIWKTTLHSTELPNVGGPRHIRSKLRWRANIWLQLKDMNLVGFGFWTFSVLLSTAADSTLTEKPTQKSSLQHVRSFE